MLASKCSCLDLRRRLGPWIELTRVDKFAGTMVLFWPYAWAVMMIARIIHLPVYQTAIYLWNGFVGACLGHSAGCIWNDILDREFDRQVERTTHRPIADGRISVRGALVFLSIHLWALNCINRNLHSHAWVLGLVSIFVLPGLYPLMKRVTYWPQAWLGLAMNCGIPMASLVMTGVITRQATILGVGAWFWTLWYDTIYACQDKRDDVQAGVKSTALLFAQYTKPLLAIFGCILVLSLLTCGIENDSCGIYYAISVCITAFLLAQAIWQVNLDNPVSCWKTFNRNGFWLGATVFVGFTADYIVALHNSPQNPLA
ncbi:UbiA prenyltransferase [Punctularia strigosozonata HHB-11173 SS5]|uniref:UbiA prenyltransferase n=1 Tax=Punctularia strigosozonata (strain HHB-11173) TaxID=741275 RepID=UPI00044185AC|nr:UbiA prenyltransferase [Punctularia strigosozonata HHB-11173 SS5]EIN06899.1 UbiA prenyltransferase [Punctularia strigosozonata HHB-11173 SS5]